MPTLDIDECIDKLWNKHEFLSEKDLKEVCLRVKEVLFLDAQQFVVQQLVVFVFVGGLSSLDISGAKV